jgi:hypothetical protein
MILAALLLAQTPAAPIRHLVYSYTYGGTRSVTTHSNGFDQAGSGVADYGDRDDATGTIVIDVLQVARDKGMLVSVSESADEPAHAAVAARCVVYPTSIACDRQANVNPEEVSVIRLLADGFVDPSVIDANNHWHVDDGGPGSSGSDYTVLSNDNNALTISERRSFGTGAQAATVTGTIDYNLAREVPTSLNETLVDHPLYQGSYVDETVTFIAKLQSDSMAH